MSLDTTPIRNAIKARVATIPGMVVFEDEIPDNETVPTTSSGKLKPYVVLYFTEPARSARGRGIVSTRHDTNMMLCTAQVIAGDTNAANLQIDNVRDVLTGWYPPDAGEMTLYGGSAYSRKGGTVAPTEYVRETVFRFPCNLTF